MITAAQKEQAEMVLQLPTLCVVVGGPESRVYGLLDITTLFVWSSQEKAQQFIDSQKLEDVQIIEEPTEGIRTKARRIGFSEMRVDFLGDGAVSDTEYLHLPL